jgi:hypothetical protein
MPSRRNRRRKNKPKPKKPSVPSYASMVKPADSAANVVPDTKDADEYDDGSVIPLPPQSRKCVTNYTPPRGRDSSRDTWEFAYFQHIVALRNIFIQNLGESSADLKYLHSTDFFDNFSQFIYDASSHYISPYLEKMPENLENDYFRYKLAD